MEKRNTNKATQSGIAMFFFIGFVILLILSFLIPKSSDGDIIIKEEISITSTVQNSLLQEYTSTITGVIKNNTNSDLENIILTFNVETDFLHNKGTLSAEIPKIKASSEFVINLNFDTNQNFETILSIRMQINGGDSFVLENDSGGMNIIFILSFICLGIGFACISSTKKTNKQLEKQIETINDNEESIQSDREIDDLEHELKKQKLISEINNYKKVKVICKYCGTTNDNHDKKCQNCGAIIENN